MDKKATRQKLLVGGCSLLAFAIGCGDDDPGPQDLDATDEQTHSDVDAGDVTDANVDDASDDADGEVWTPPVRAYDATIRRDEFGVAHILADDVASAAFGQGYSFAEDHICTLADQIVAVRSERSLYFGPGEDDANLTNDFGILALGVYANAEAGFSSQPRDIQEAILGYTTGYNRYLEEVGLDAIHSVCRGAEWVKPISTIDLYAYYLYLGELGSGLALLDMIGTAQAPDPRGGNKTTPLPLDAMPNFREARLGSNGWGIGSTMSSTGRGMLLANPHFPYRGELTWYESQLTVPGELNIYGASLMGVAAINIGFNEDVAWTHTVSSAPRFTMYRLTINPQNPTQYQYDGQWRDMTPSEFAIEVRNPDGTTRTEQRTYWSTHYGPMLNAPLFGWSQTLGFSMRNANSNNDRLIEQWWRMNRADGLDSFVAAHAEVRGIPWVNTMYADAEGNAFYIDSSAVPNLTEAAETELLSQIETDQITRTFYGFGIWLLDGSDPLFEWEEQEGARAPGLIPYDEAPQLLRDDFVSNANDSHWLTNSLAPLEGYSELYGGERTARSLRTRMNLRMLTERGASSEVGEDGVFTLAELQQTVLNSRSMAAELIRDDLVALCEGIETVEVPPESGDGPSALVPVAAACDVLAAWNGRFELDAAGPILLREALSEFGAADVSAAGDLLAVDFDADDAVNTPNTVTPAVEGETHPLLLGLARGILRLEAIGFDANTTLGEAQFTTKGEDRIPWHGGSERDGTIAISTWGGANRTLLPPIERGEVVNSVTDLTVDGYVVDYGNSFVMTVQYTDAGPVAGAFVTYSASSDPDSPHYADQTLAYSEREWRPVRYTEADIAAAPGLRTYTVTYAP